MFVDDYKEASFRHKHSISLQPVQVLLQGFCLQSSNCEDITQRITDDITTLENSLARGIYMLCIDHCSGIIKLVLEV